MTVIHHYISESPQDLISDSGTFPYFTTPSNNEVRQVIYGDIPYDKDEIEGNYKLWKEHLDENGPYPIPDKKID